jgi:hypothetical protein
MPFGAMQIIIIWATSYGAYTWKNKSAVIAALVIPVVVGLSLLFGKADPGIVSLSLNHVLYSSETKRRQPRLAFVRLLPTSVPLWCKPLDHLLDDSEHRWIHEEERLSLWVCC